MKTNCKWEHPYTPDPAYSKRAVYFSMEFGIDTAMKIYSGGLGYLAGSHMRSAYQLKQNMIGIGMLWKYGYYDQVRDHNSAMKVLHRERFYSFLQPTDLMFPVDVKGHQVQVQAYYLDPEVFGTVPMYFLTTDLEHENDYLSSTITHQLYVGNGPARVAQSIVLGIGGAKVVEALGGAEVYHLNEAHALPLAFYLYQQHKDIDKLREQLVFTTHTPVRAGNEERDINFLHGMGFFAGLSLEEVREVTQHPSGDVFGYTPAALVMAKRSNGVSQLHAEVSNKMWEHVDLPAPIIGITNAQNQTYWQDPQLKAALDADDDEALVKRKKELKKQLFDIVADQTGHLLNPDLLTVVWARRFADYKRADLIMRDLHEFYDLLNRAEQPMQFIWAGKPYPGDGWAIDLFNKLVQMTRLSHTAAVLTGYEMNLSAALKKGSDVWLNTPRRPKEASGTSGMTAAMNASVNFSTFDGWIPEFAQHGHNSFVIPPADPEASVEEQDEHDYQHLIRILKEEIIPTYYEKPKEWLRIVKNSMREVVPKFDSGRMADEYYRRLY
ncbi:MAG: alpha-glucan family phosphorylase [Bacteroidetes bacterium]|nr:MAG: alpha-glucan family phosphorylase [Bacteroidota bacterium]